ncbi:MAG: DNA replication/repair protein RecF [Bacteroidota bacterium]
MHLEAIHLVNFRNYQEQKISFCEGLNIISGKNGAGKTNLLEAINYLCLTKGYFHSGDLGAINFNKEYFRLQGEFITDEKTETISLAFQSGTPKLLQHDKIDYEKLADHIGKFPLVVIAPDDIVLILEGSEERRKWLDNTISQVNGLYLNDLMQYNRILSQRNALLKQWASGVRRDKQLMNVFDDQLVSLGKQIFEERKKCLQTLIPILQKHYAFISDEHETALMNYESLLNDKDFSKVLQANRERDIVLQRTTSGIHRDDLDFLLNENSFKKFGSQGQKKSFLIALKLAQFDFIKEKKNCTPLLLLDDIFDKLDQHRSEKLLADATSNNRGQVFITCTEWNGNIKSAKTTRHFSVENGLIN